MTAAQSCLALLAQHSKSFALAARLLPATERAEVAALYAWCRRADDAIDVPGAEAPASALLRLERELESVYRGAAQQDFVLAAFQRVVLARRIPRDYPRALLDGLAMDVARVHYPTLEALLAYCYNVAGTVGLMLCYVLGVRDAGALRNAAHLGIAMQLTNVSRDVLEDWHNGRCYLPESLLLGAPPFARDTAPHRQTRAAHAVGKAVATLLEAADGYYRSADRGLSALPWRAALAIRTARLVYAAIGDRIRSGGYAVLRGRAVVSRTQKLALVVRAFVAELGVRCFGRARPVARAPLELVRCSDVVSL
jgi:15-cis-phytoene synthase